MSPTTPSPDCSPDLAIDIAKHRFADPVFIVVAPASQNRVEVVNHGSWSDRRVPSQPVPNPLEEGFDLLLVRSAETLMLEVTNGKTQEVTALLDRHDLSLFPIQFQPSHFQPILQDWDDCFDVCFAFCRDQEVVCIAAVAVGWGRFLVGLLLFRMG